MFDNPYNILFVVHVFIHLEFSTVYQMAMHTQMTGLLVVVRVNIDITLCSHAIFPVRRHLSTPVYVGNHLKVAV